MSAVFFSGPIGVQEVLPPGAKSALAFFTQFWTEEIWDELVIQTNLYAEQQRAQGLEYRKLAWKPVDNWDLKAWMGNFYDIHLIPFQ